jgi:UDP-N-acetylmuramoyl-L-alanyl-D-glutamate--2,6-diaminopimelate ligase
VDVGQPFEVLVDYAHTVNAFRSVLAALRPPPPRRLIAVFGAAGNRDRAKRPMLARLAREYADFFIVTNEDPFDEEPEAIISEITAGVPADERGRRFEIEADRGRAIEAGVVMARPGDRVVILGKGHEHSIVVNGRKETWSDVAAARDALAVRR